MTSEEREYQAAVRRARAGLDPFHPDFPIRNRGRWLDINVDAISRIPSYNPLTAETIESYISSIRQHRIAPVVSYNETGGSFSWTAPIEPVITESESDLTNGTWTFINPGVGGRRLTIQVPREDIEMQGVDHLAMQEAEWLEARAAGARDQIISQLNAKTFTLIKEFMAQNPDKEELSLSQDGRTLSINITGDTPLGILLTEYTKQSAKRIYDSVEHTEGELLNAAMAIMIDDPEKFPESWPLEERQKLASQPYEKRLIIAAAFLMSEAARQRKINQP